VEEPVKALLQILLAGFVAFMGLAIAQEWEMFSSAWFGEPEPRVTMTDEENKAVSDTVHLTLSLMRHLYLSGGDPRFAERIPAAQGIVEEVLADVKYLARNRRVQDTELIRLDVLAVDPLAEGRAEVRTRERWQVRVRWAHGGGEAAPPRLHELHGRYLVVLGGKGWRVEGWEIIDPDDEADAGTA
jgi:hypothetical protein